MPGDGRLTEVHFWFTYKVTHIDKLKEYVVVHDVRVSVLPSLIRYLCCEEWVLEVMLCE